MRKICKKVLIPLYRKNRYKPQNKYEMISTNIEFFKMCRRNHHRLENKYAINSTNIEFRERMR